MASPRLAPQSDGFEWRTLLGPTHSWPTPATNLIATDRSVEQCELCGKTIGDGKPFVTDSTGQKPVHVACSDGALEGQQAGFWCRILLRFRRHSLPGH